MGSWYWRKERLQRRGRRRTIEKNRRIQCTKGYRKEGDNPGKESTQNEICVKTPDGKLCITLSANLKINQITDAGRVSVKRCLYTALGNINSSGHFGNM